MNFEKMKDEELALWLWKELYKGTPKHLVMNYQFVQYMFLGLATTLKKEMK